MDNFTDGPSSQGHASGIDMGSLDDRVQTLLNNLLGELMMSETVAIEIGVARQRIAEWRRDARRYSIITALPAGEYQTLVRRGAQRGASFDALVDSLADEGSSSQPSAVPRLEGSRTEVARIDGRHVVDVGFEDARVEFFKRQGYWADLVGTCEDED